MTLIDPVRRFYGRVDSYVKYRPGYPRDVLETMVAECGMTADKIVADVGSGTGFLSRLMLEYGNVVYCVEPNRDMREEAERTLSGYQNFHSVSARAEETTLADSSVDLITVAQAFHWFDKVKVREEFLRILKPGGWVVIIFNLRIVSSPFLDDYELLLRTHGTDYAQVKQVNVGANELDAFFGRGWYGTRTFEGVQNFDFEGLLGRVRSSSYMPAEEQPGYESMVTALHTLFDRHQTSGIVKFHYSTVMYYGQLGSGRGQYDRRETTAG